MKSRILFLVLCFFNFVFAYNICPGPNSTPNGDIERNAAEIYPNDEAVLSDDGKRFITYKYNPDKRANEITNCAAYTCGRKTFPHGIHFEMISDKPVMLCEQHRCLNPEKIKCRKTVEYGACSGENEYVAGFIVRKNATNEWLEVECCRYEKNLDSTFVKLFAVTPSVSYKHEIFIENGIMTATDYVKDIKKTVDIFGKTILSVSIYRMKCDPTNMPQNVSNVFDKRETLIDADGIGKFENETKTCDVLSLGFTWDSNTPCFYCLPEKCINNNKIVCQNDVSVESCIGNNKWVAAFGKDSSGAYNMSIVKCCEYNETAIPNFDKYQMFNITTVTVDNTVHEEGIPIKMIYVNNITEVDNINGTVIYSASTYSLPCSNFADQIISVQQKWQQGSIESLFRDLMSRMSKKVMKDEAANIPVGMGPLIEAQQNSLIDAAISMAANPSTFQNRNGSKSVQREDIFKNFPKNFQKEDNSKNSTSAIEIPTTKMLLRPSRQFVNP